SEYWRQLREKQKTRRVYNVTERQFRRYYAEALQTRGMTGVNLLGMLERRLDNVVYRLNFAESRAQGRLLVTHGHFSVNGRRTDIPSMLIKPGDVIEVREGSRKRTYFKALLQSAESRAAPKWLERDSTSLSARVIQNPERGDIDANLNEQLIVEFYSR
ncbi:MAG TPA: 30S ribosomal protein S4, partial [Anaerolineales bacterium]|nr:30S ribosomal protein S4 [Anaerolineales bacterium]